MISCAEKTDSRHSFRVPVPFSFHHKDKVLKGKNIGKIGFGLVFPIATDGSFQYHRSEQLKNCYIQIEGHTIYFSKVSVCWLDVAEDGLIYGFRIDSIIEPEKAKYDEAYAEALRHYRERSVLSISEKNALDNFLG